MYSQNLLMSTIANILLELWLLCTVTAVEEKTDT